MNLALSFLVRVTPDAVKRRINSHKRPVNYIRMEGLANYIQRNHGIYSVDGIVSVFDSENAHLSCIGLSDVTVSLRAMARNGLKGIVERVYLAAKVEDDFRQEELGGLTILEGQAVATVYRDFERFIGLVKRDPSSVDFELQVYSTRSQGRTLNGEEISNIARISTMNCSAPLNRQLANRLSSLRVCNRA